LPNRAANSVSDSSIWCVLVLAVALLFSATAPALADPAEAPLRVGMGDSHGVETGWVAIMKEAGITIERVKVSHARRRRMFLEGFILVDCCMTPEWRDTEEDNAIQLFTDVFYQSQEVYIFGSGTAVPITKLTDLSALRVAVIRGFSYVNAEYFGSTILALNLSSQFTLVESGRADMAIVSKVDFLHYMARRPRALEIGGVQSVAGLRIRVHKSRADLIPRLNVAIANLKPSGALIKLIETPHK